MVASNFHKQIQKAFRREVALHETEAKAQLDKGVKHQLVSHYYDRAVGHLKGLRLLLQISQIPNLRAQ